MAAASIAVNGGDWFASVGTEKSKGTKILSICGDCSRPGIYEYPFGTSIQSVLDDCGASDVLGIQIGGPSGTFISNQEFDRKLAFEDLATGGSFIVFNNSRNILDIVNNFTHFFAHESCGFCTPCRVGTSLLKKQLDKIVDGHGSAGDVVALEEICQLIKNHSHCGLGQTAANPVLTTLERYPELYQSHLKNPHIITRGPEWFAAIGSPPKSTGTRVFCVSGHVKRPGNYEVPMGMTVRELVYEYAGGMRSDKPMKAFIPGGASAPFLTPAHLDVKLDFEHVAAAGSMLGSGGVTVMEEGTSMVWAALRLMEFFYHESCGKCSPCREGSSWLVQTMRRILAKRGRMEDLETLLDLCKNIAGRTVCAFGDAEVAPIQSTLKHWRQEYVDLINEAEAANLIRPEPVGKP